MAVELLLVVELLLADDRLLAVEVHIGFVVEVLREREDCRHSYSTRDDGNADDRPRKRRLDLRQ